MSNLNISLVQTDLHWEDSPANEAMMDTLIADLQDIDLVVLPEMWNTGFSNNSKDLAQGMDGSSVMCMRKWAKNKNAVVTGSLMISVGGTYYNRMLWVQPDGAITHYDKRHLFRMAGEHNHFEPGSQRVIVEHKGWRIMLQVCYDLRFPVFTRNRYMDGSYEYDLILYVANWPSPRHNAWDTLLQARAMENLSYCVGVNRTGKDANGLVYNGGSAIIDYLGKPLNIPGLTPEIITASIGLTQLRSFRDKFPTGMDADSFILKQ